MSDLELGMFISASQALGYPRTRSQEDDVAIRSPRAGRWQLIDAKEAFGYPRTKKGYVSPGIAIRETDPPDPDPEFVEGNGTEGNPFQIWTWNQFRRMLRIGTSAHISPPLWYSRNMADGIFNALNSINYYVLMADIFADDEAILDVDEDPTATVKQYASMFLDFNGYKLEIAKETVDYRFLFSTTTLYKPKMKLVSLLREILVTSLSNYTVFQGDEDGTWEDHSYIHWIQNSPYSPTSAMRSTFNYMHIKISWNGQDLSVVPLGVSDASLLFSYYGTTFNHCVIEIYDTVVKYPATFARLVLNDSALIGTITVAGEAAPFGMWGVATPPYHALLLNYGDNTLPQKFFTDSYVAIKVVNATEEPDISIGIAAIANIYGFPTQPVNNSFIDMELLTSEGASPYSNHFNPLLHLTTEQSKDAEYLTSVWNETFDKVQIPPFSAWVTHPDIFDGYPNPYGIPKKVDPGQGGFMAFKNEVLHNMAIIDNKVIQEVHYGEV